MKIIDVNGNERDCDSITTDKGYPGYVKIKFKNDRREYVEWYTIDEFISKNPNLKSLITNAPKPRFEDLGRVTTATELSLTDKKKTWQKDIFKNLPIWISRGKGESQVRKVLSNGKNTVVIDKPWLVIPDKSSQYVVSQNIHSPNIFDNNFPDVPKVNKSKKIVTPTINIKLPKK